MFVLKRSGVEQEFDPRKISARIESLCSLNPILKEINVHELLIKINIGICPDITTSQIDDLASDVCASLSTVHYEYGNLASRLIVSNLHKRTKKFGTFSAKILRVNVLNDDVRKAVLKYKNIIDGAIDYERDYYINYFGMKTLMKSYLLKVPKRRKRHNKEDSFSKNNYNNINKENQNVEQSNISLTLRDKKTYKRNKQNIDNEENIECMYSSNEAITQNSSKNENADVEVEMSNNNTSVANERTDKNIHASEKIMENDYESINAKEDEIFETPQDIFMRVALGIHREDIRNVLLSYHLISNKYFTHATPTLFNSSLDPSQLSSCFLLDMREDTLVGIYETLKQCALISKHSGGIGLSIHRIRASGSSIGFNGRSNGIVPMLKVFDATARYVDQGGNKRPGSIAIYIEPWHADIFEFIDLRKNTGKEEYRTRDLFLGLWICDLFMKRVEENKNWSLFCPNDTRINREEWVELKKRLLKENEGKNMFPENDRCEEEGVYEEEINLFDLYGKDFEIYYEYLEKCGKERRKIKAQMLWKAIIEAQIETGNPYILFKDHCNRKNNQKNLGTLKSSNLCTEILQYTNKDEISVCNLASIALPKFIKKINDDKVSINSIKKDIDHYLIKNNIEECEGDYSDNESRHRSQKSPPNKIKIATQDDTYRSDIKTPESVDENNMDTHEDTHKTGINTKNNTYKNDIDLHNKENIDNQADSKQKNAENIYINSDGEEVYFDFDLLIEVAGIITENLNKVIDINFYPIKEAENSNRKHRPIGIGVQGLADVFFILRIPFESEEARKINKRIFECIYYGSLKSSINLSRKLGTYGSYKGSPISNGYLQFDFYNQEKDLEHVLDTYLDLDWQILRDNIKIYGVRNSLLIAPMPTASTSQILGYNECIEPITSNIYTRRTLAGEFQVVNTYLLKDLIKLNLWSNKMKNLLIENEGSIQNIKIIPNEIKEIYKNAWEMKMKNILNMAIDRTHFIDQSQSLNLFVAEPTYAKLTSMHFYGWKKGLKTGMYYLRTKPVAMAIKFTVDKKLIQTSDVQESCSIGDGDCTSCGS